MDALEIQYRLKRKGITIAEIGRRVGTTRQAVYSVCKRQYYSEATADAIAQALGVPREDVFPDYDAWPRRRRGRQPKTSNWSI